MLKCRLVAVVRAKLSLNGCQMKADGEPKHAQRLCVLL